MNKQETINGFLSDFADFLERYYSSTITSISKKSQDNWLEISIAGPNGSIMKLSSWGAEVTLAFGQGHWHIDNYDEPCNFNDIFKTTIDDVIDVLRCQTTTYSCWRNGGALGGSSCSIKDENDIITDARKVFDHFDEIRMQTWADELKVKKGISPIVDQ